MSKLMIKKDTQQVKVIELVGQKLDPKAKYLFVVDRAAFTDAGLRGLHERLFQVVGDNFVLATTPMPPKDALVVHEVMPNE